MNFKKYKKYITDVDSFHFSVDNNNSDLYSQRKHKRFIEQFVYYYPNSNEVREHDIIHTYWFETDYDPIRYGRNVDIFGGTCVQEGIHISINL